MGMSSSLESRHRNAHAQLALSTTDVAFVMPLQKGWAFTLTSLLARLLLHTSPSDAEFVMVQSITRSSILLKSALAYVANVAGATVS